MKYTKLIWVFCALLASLTHGLYAQDSPKIDIDAIVVDSENMPIGGAVIHSDSEDIIAVTDTIGAFAIQARQNSILVVSATGYKDKAVNATSALSEVVLELDIDEVHLLFRTIDKKDLVGGVSVLNLPELLQKNFFYGPADGLETQVAGFNGNSIWGRGNLLILIDGIPRSYENITASEVEQITVLKGAAAVALYGSLAVDGVISITTKKGVIGDQKIDVTVNTGMFVPKSYPDYLGSADYMKYYNEARINDGLSPSFDQSTIDNTRSGVNPYRYPDVDFYSSDFIKKAYNRSDVRAEISGGNENARYYTNVGFLRDGSLIDFGEAQKNSYQRFNLKGNVDVNLNKWLSANVDVGAIFQSGRGAHPNYWEEASTVRPTMGSNPFAPLIPISMIDLTNDDNRVLVENSKNIIDDKYLLGGTLSDQTNPIAGTYVGGYNKGISRQFLFNTGLDMDLSGIATGLTFKTKIGLDYNTTYNQGYTHTYRIYEPTWTTIDGVDIVTSMESHETIDSKSISQYISDSWYQQLLYFSGQLDYKRSFDKSHNIHAMLIGNNYQYSVSGEYHGTNSSNLGMYFGYNFLNKYYLDFNGALMHSVKLPPNKRTAFSPVLSLGWRISEESFMEGASGIDNLKLTATAGRTYSDSNIEDYYMYASRYQYRDAGYYTWSAGMGRDVTASLRGANENLRAPHRDEISVGIEASFFKRLIEMEGNYFSINYFGGIIEPIDLFPNFMMTGYPESSFLPYFNYNEEKRNGYDFSIKLNKKMGGIDWRLGVVGTYYDTEILKRSNMYNNDYQYREGTPIDGIWGLQSDGFFADQADIDGSSRQSTYGDIKPGDIKYIDQNGDGVINSDDQVYLAKGGWYGAPFTMGVNLTAKWKNLTFYAQGVGRWGGHGVKDKTTDWVYGDRKYSEVVLNRWAHYTNPDTNEEVDTRATATYPRLTTQGGANNFQTSDFWLYKTDRFDISKVQITFSFPERMIKNTFLGKVDVYVGGSNLLTISPEKKYLETNVGSAPQTRFYNLGVSASF